MTIFPRISTTTIGRHKDAPRVWLEGRYLLDAGFEPTNRIQVEFTKGQVVIRLAKDGPRVVSSKRQGQIPVLDLNSTALTEAFGPISTLQVHIALINHWNTQIAKGNGFASAQISDDSTSIPCISKRYMAGQGT